MASAQLVFRSRVRRWKWRRLSHRVPRTGEAHRKLDASQWLSHNGGAASEANSVS